MEKYLQSNIVIAILCTIEENKLFWKISETESSKFDYPNSIKFRWSWKFEFKGNIDFYSIDPATLNEIFQNCSQSAPLLSILKNRHLKNKAISWIENKKSDCTLQGNIFYCFKDPARLCVHKNNRILKFHWF